MSSAGQIMSITKFVDIARLHDVEPQVSRLVGGAKTRSSWAPRGGRSASICSSPSACQAPAPATGLGNLLILSQRLQTPPNTPSLNHCVVEETPALIHLISGLAKSNKLKMPSPKGATRRLLQSGAHTNPSPGMRIPRSQPCRAPP